MRIAWYAALSYFAHQATQAIPIELNSSGDMTKIELT